MRIPRDSGEVQKLVFFYYYYLESFNLGKIFGLKGGNKIVLWLDRSSRILVGYRIQIREDPFETQSNHLCKFYVTTR